MNTRTTRVCAACGRKLWDIKSALAPCYRPNCGACTLWSRLIHMSHYYRTTRVGTEFAVLVRILVRGVARELLATANTVRGDQP